MNLDELRVLVSVVEHGSLGAAAKTLRFPLATLRRRLDELEVRMGVKLLERSHHGVVPTSAGAVLVAKARGLLHEVQSLRDLVRGAGAEASGEIAVALPLGLPPSAVSAFLVLMSELYPGLSWRIRVAEDPLRGLKTGMQVAFCLRDKAPERPWIVSRLVTFPERLVASRDYLDRHGTPARTEDLARHRLLLWEGPDRPGDTLPLRGGATLPVTPLLRMTDIFLLRHHAARGAGIAFVPDGSMPVDWLFGDEGLVPVLEEEVTGQISLWVVASPAMLALPRIQVALEQFAKLGATLNG